MPPKAKDPDTVRAVYSLPDKAVVLQAARSVVSVSSFRQVYWHHHSEVGGELSDSDEFQDCLRGVQID
nr:unnamed protein product [Digitaria exilis]